MDERKSRNAGNAAQAGLGLLMLATLTYMTVDYLRHDRVGTWPVIILIGTGVLFWFFNRSGASANPPRRWWGQGEELPTEPDQRPTRIRSYALDSTLFTVGSTILTAGGLTLGRDTLSLDALTAWTGLTGTPLTIAFLATELVGLWLVSFALTYRAGETAATSCERELAHAE